MRIEHQHDNDDSKRRKPRGRLPSSHRFHGTPIKINFALHDAESREDSTINGRELPHLEAKEAHSHGSEGREDRREDNPEMHDIHNARLQRLRDERKPRLIRKYLEHLQGD